MAKTETTTLDRIGTVSLASRSGAEKGRGKSSPAPCVEGGNDGLHGEGGWGWVGRKGIERWRGWLTASLWMVEIVRWTVGCCVRYLGRVGVQRNNVVAAWLEEACQGAKTPSFGA